MILRFGSHYDGYMPDYILDLFINASKAVYSDHEQYPIVDCNVSNVPIIELNVTGVSQKLVLFPDDYIIYKPRLKRCVVNIEGYTVYSPQNSFYMPAQFLNNHCIAYNIKTKQIGFSNARKHHINFG
uniref:Peptidase A1 domain-containing protein n=1 Tax=Ditylenchus dipsaci TaxID=166011 RepID=A0A915DQ45_9BILA